MHFRSITNLYQDVWSSLHRLPHDIDVVVGVPRSGMLPATMIALAGNLPLADLDGFLEGRLLSAGKTRREIDGAKVKGFVHALIVDDSCRTGASMREARAKLASIRHKISFAVVYGTHQQTSDVDIVFARVPEPRVFEWNVLHHPIVSRACFDIDGVLCVDPTERQNDDGGAYLDFVLNASPLHRPRRQIAKLVTSRLEKYREPTEAWLARHGIRYAELCMLDLPDAATRRRLGVHASFKAQVYRTSDCALFVESELHQAREIARLSGRPVLSLSGPEMIRPGMMSPRALGQKFGPVKLQAKLSRVAGRMWSGS
jgi:uncharacterized HAD superfamily protein/adenine/guanine phosphoribosyltransferase-like PRPP-binding protein